MTLVPRCPSIFAVAAPIPRAPPVTIATFSFICMFFSFSILLWNVEVFFVRKFGERADEHFSGFSGQVGCMAQLARENHEWICWSQLAIACPISSGESSWGV